MKRGVYPKNFVLAGAAVLFLTAAGTAMAIPASQNSKTVKTSEVIATHPINHSIWGSSNNTADLVLSGPNSLIAAEMLRGSQGFSRAHSPIQQILNTPPNTTATKPIPQGVGVPDGGPTMAMLGGAFGGLVLLKGRLHRRRI
jgi:hypothetical protein